MSWLREVDSQWWCDVDAVGGWAPKNGKGRSIPIPSKLADKLTELRDEGKKLQEIAAIMDVSLSTVQRYLKTQAA